MAKIGPDEWIAAQRRDQRVSRSRLAGLYMAGLIVALPAITALPMTAIAGEGDYIILVVGVFWAVLAVAAYRFRWATEHGSVRHACAFWVMLWSTILALLMIAFAVTLLVNGEWGYYPPETVHSIRKGS